MNNDDKFRKHLLDTFLIEADEHLKTMTNNLLELESLEDLERQDELIEIIFRETHSLKGASRAVDQTQIESVCQALESVLSLMKKKDLIPVLEHFNLFLKVGDFLGERLLALDQKLSKEQTIQMKTFINDLNKIKLSLDNKNDKKIEPKKKVDLESFESQMNFDHKNSFLKEPTENHENKEDEIPFIDQADLVEPTIKAAIGHDKVRVSASRLSAVLLQSEEMLSVKLAANQRTLNIKSTNLKFEVWKKEWSKILPIINSLKLNSSVVEIDNRSDRRHQKQLSIDKIIDFLDWNNEFFKSFKDQYGNFKKNSEKDSQILFGMVDNLLEDMKKVMMFPFSSIFELFPKIVRDIANESGKKVQLDLKGGEIEIDRRILEEIKDPFIHLIRNSVDHGIETSEDRIKKNKSETGLVKIEVFPKNQMVEIIISDDGAGINLEDVRVAAYKNGAFPKATIDKMTDEEIVSFIYQSGVSTSPIISKISGHGLGLAIVREKVEKLGGAISFESKPNEGTCFHIVIPLTIATLRGILVEVCQQTFVVPTMYVQRVVRVKTKDIKTVENQETIVLNDKVTSLVPLRNILQLQKSDYEDREYVQAIILNDGGIQLAISVDRVLNEQEVLFKNLGKLLSRVNNIAGATVLGTGKAVPIINVSDLMKSAIKASFTSSMGVSSEESYIQTKRYSVLVAEDSITTRTLLKNILETAGFDVTTAVDGADGFDIFKKRQFDAVVSDVEMPRMNGFELTSNIRSSANYSDTPVILVTALASRTDKEKGIDVGADAYIVKSSFDQSDLLEVLNRLIIKEE